MLNNKSRVYLSVLTILTLVLISCSKKDLINIEPQFETEETSKVFPDDWLGYWTGELEIHDVNGLKQKLPMALDHQKTDTKGEYIWAIIYGEDTVKGRRDYLLKEVDKSQGHFQVDEKNSILLDCFLINNHLISEFEVTGNRISSDYYFEGEDLIFQIVMSQHEAINITGDSLINEEQIPAVQSFQTKVIQRARLKQKKTLSK